MRHILPGVVRAAVLCLALAPLAPAFSSGMPLRQFDLRDSYQIGEGGASPAGTPASSSGVSAGPIRLARFSYVKGNVTWRPSEGAAWSPASVNLPIRQGAQVWVTDGGRAEVQFDDGSLLRLGGGAVTTLQTLFSDADGEFTEIQMNEGLSTLELRGPKSIYQVDTPIVSVKSEGPSRVRVGVDSNVEVAVQNGSAAIEGSGHKVVLDSGSYLDLADADSPFEARALPDADGWDQWNDSRDRQLADAGGGDRLPANIALVAGDLGDYGEWHDDPQYGHVWCPTVTDAGWRPYRHGSWTWVEPFGWTWVSSEAWGWAPYHYGTWVDEPYGWAWVPGPARQYWCPAVVHFSEYNGAVAWVPLCPREVRYPPAVRLGYRGGGWSLSFSIGGAAVYYPQNESYCAPRPFDNVVVNRVTYVNNVTNITNINVTNVNRVDYRPTTVNRNIYLTNTRFIPFNARNAAGVTTASVASFGGRGEYQDAPRGSAAFFVRGRSIGAPAAGSAPVAGPISARPTAAAFTPSRTFLSDARPDAPILRRPLFRTALPAPVARFAPSSPRYQASGSRPGAASFPGVTRAVTPGRPFLPRPGSVTGSGPLGSRRPARSYQGAPGSSGPSDQASQAARDARRSLGQTPPEGARPGAIQRRPSPDAQAGGDNAARPARPARVFTGGPAPQERPQDAPRELGRPAREAPRAPETRPIPLETSRPEPVPVPRVYRSREAAPQAQPQPREPERAPREERRPAPPENGTPPAREQPKEEPKEQPKDPPKDDPKDQPKDPPQERSGGRRRD